MWVTFRQVLLGLSEAFIEITLFLSHFRRSLEQQVSHLSSKWQRVSTHFGAMSEICMRTALLINLRFFISFASVIYIYVNSHRVVFDSWRIWSSFFWWWQCPRENIQTTWDSLSLLKSLTGKTFWFVTGPSVVCHQESWVLGLGGRKEDRQPSEMGTMRLFCLWRVAINRWLSCLYPLLVVLYMESSSNPVPIPHGSGPASFTVTFHVHQLVSSAGSTLSTKHQARKKIQLQPSDLQKRSLFVV